MKNYQWWYIAAVLNLVCAVIWGFGNTNKALGFTFLSLAILDWCLAIGQKKDDNKEK